MNMKLSMGKNRVVRAGEILLGKIKYHYEREINYQRSNPVDALFFLTYRCTSKCKTCMMWERQKQVGEMDVNGWKRAIDMCYAMGVRWIELFGGDALLRKDILISMIQYMQKYPDIISFLVTNCNLLDQETAESLVRAGLDEVWISMDSVGEDHDVVRGREGTFSRVERGIDFLLKYKNKREKPLLRANCTISRYNFDTFEKVIYHAEQKGMDDVHLHYVGEFWPETLKKTQINGIHPTPYFVRADGETSLVTRSEANRIKDKIESIKQEAKSMRIRLHTENVDKLTIDNMIHGRFDNYRCYILRNKVTVDPAGNILGCPFYDGWKMGNILEEPLQKIWNNKKHTEFKNAFDEGVLKFCRYCVLGVQRNPTPFQDFRDDMNRLLGRVRR